MNKLTTILLLSFGLCLSGKLVLADTTNLPPDNDKVVRAGTIVITQNGVPADKPAQAASQSVAEEWVIPILRLIVWPGLVAAVIWFYRKEIRSKLANVTTVKGGKNVSVEFAPAMSEQQKASAGTPNKPEITGNHQEFEKVKAEASSSSLVKQRAAQILENLQKANFTDPQKMELGAVVVAGLQVENHFWKAFNFIFGTQIALLQELNSRPLPEQAVQTYFEGVKARFPDVYSSATRDGYLAFLLNYGLIQIIEGQYAITEQGREFLVWMARSQLSPNKPL